MFTTECLIEELLPCKIGEQIWTIDKNKNYKDDTYTYEIDSDECNGFIIDTNYETNRIEIKPAYDTWDGWCEINDHDLGYYTSREEAVAKVKEFKEVDEFEKQNKWLKEIGE